MDNYPEEFTELQKRPNDDLAGMHAILCNLNRKIPVDVLVIILSQ